MIIRLKQIRVATWLGVRAEEQEARRPVIINLLIDFDHMAALASDSIADTIDYAAIEILLATELAEQRFMLLESLAEYVGMLIMASPLVREVTVEVEKPGAMQIADTVSVIHTMRRE